MREWWRKKSLEERREIIARRDKDLVRAADQKRYHESLGRREFIDARAKAWAEHHPAARAAQHAVSNAIRDGRLTPGPCEFEQAGDCCGPINAHHDDYEQPLAVRWLCRSHHTRVHVELGSVAEAA